MPTITTYIAAAALALCTALPASAQDYRAFCQKRYQDNSALRRQCVEAQGRAVRSLLDWCYARGLDIDNVFDKRDQGDPATLIVFDCAETYKPDVVQVYCCITRRGYKAEDLGHIK